jgi:hypothetical protein
MLDRDLIRRRGTAAKRAWIRLIERGKLLEPPAFRRMVEILVKSIRSVQPRDSNRQLTSGRTIIPSPSLSIAVGSSIERWAVIQGVRD